MADHVYSDEGTGKVVIAGTFDTVYAPGFPAKFSRETYAFVSLSSIHGRTPVQVEYVDLSDGEVLMSYGPIHIDSSDPLACVDFWIPVPPLLFPHPGFYALEVFAEHDLLGRVRIGAELIEEEQTDEDTGNDQEDFE